MHDSTHAKHLATTQYLAALLPPYNAVRAGAGEVTLYSNKEITRVLTTICKEVSEFISQQISEQSKSPVILVLSDGGCWLASQIITSEAVSPFVGKNKVTVCELDAKRYSDQNAVGPTSFTPRHFSNEELSAVLKDAPILVIDDMIDQGGTLRDLQRLLSEHTTGPIKFSVLMTRFPVDQSLPSVANDLLGSPLILAHDFPDEASHPWVFGCGPDWGRDSEGSSEKTLSRYRCSHDRMQQPVVAAMAHSLGVGDLLRLVALED